MKTNAAFKLSKTAKRALAIIHNPSQCSAWKRCLIEAEHASQQQPRRNKEKTR